MPIFYVPTTTDTIVGGSTIDDQLISIVDPVLANFGGNQSLFGGLGNDTYLLGNTGAGVAGDIVTELFNEGIDTVVLFTNVNGAYTLTNNVENLISRRFTPAGGPGSAATALNGNQLNNLITVDDGNFLNATASIETLDGGIGNDTMAGGLGNDIYNVDSALDVINEGASAFIGGFLVTGFVNGVVQGNFIDLVNATVSYTLGANLENLTLSGAPTNLNFNGTGNLLPNLITGNGGNNVLDALDGNDTVTGAAGNDTLKGGGGNDTLDGGTGNDSYDGGAGNDTFLLDNAADVLLADGGGVDVAMITNSATWNSFTLPLFLENVFAMANFSVTLTGNAIDNQLFGNGSADTLTGLDGNDYLDGGAGTDSLSGGKGNDTYILDTLNDVVAPENLNEGIDAVFVTLTVGQIFTLGNNFERLTLTGTANAHGTGNALDNAILGNSGNNTLLGQAGNDNINGLAGTDMISGGLGNDALDGDAGNDSISGAAGNDTLFGGAGNDTMEGGDGVDLMDGGAGADSMSGGKGNDIYFVDTLTIGNPNLRDIVFELPGTLNGIDLVNSSVTIPELFANVENLTLTGTANIDGTGNALTNLITGNTGNNVLDAGRDLLADTLIGGLGNDTYLLYSQLDVVTEVPNVLIPGVPPTLAPGFLDTVIYRGLATPHTLAANVENLILDTGIGNINAIGNVLDNNIAGSGGNNSIDGGAGNDTINGGNGNDTLLGGAGNDSLNGNLGVDSLVGGAGDDTYVLDEVTDVVDELTGGGGNDTVVSFVRDISIATSGERKGAIENITLGGGALNATGNDLANIIRGNASQNVMTGAKGNDTYFANLGDQVVELSDAVVNGMDTVNLDVGASGLTINVRTGVAPGFIPAGELWNVENVTLLGTGNSNVIIERNTTTATQINILIGNDGANILDGSGGADSMTGGKGNDTYYVDNAGDKTVELAGAGQGIDTVFSTVAWTLQLETEHLNLIGTGPQPVAGTGNLLDNFIRGNGAVNALNGLAGNDTLDGGGGNDAMNGADGNDTYWVDSLADTVSDSTGTDTEISTYTGAGAITMAANIENLVLFNGFAIMPAAMNGVGNAIDNRITANLATNSMNGMAGSDIFDFNIIGSLTAADTVDGGGADAIGNDTLLADLSGQNLTLSTLSFVESAVLRVETGHGLIDFGALGWDSMRSVTATGSGAFNLTVNNAPTTGFANGQPSGTALIFGLEDVGSLGTFIVNGVSGAPGASDVLNLQIRDSGMSTLFQTTSAWEKIRINNTPSPDGSFAANTLSLAGLALGTGGTELEVTGSGGGQLNLTQLAAASLGGGLTFDRDLQISVVGFTDRLGLTSTGATLAQVNVQDSSFWLTATTINSLELYAKGATGPALNSFSQVHLDETSPAIATLTVKGDASSILTVDGVRAGTIDATAFLGQYLTVFVEGTGAVTWNGANGLAVLDFTSGGGGDTFNFNTAFMFGGADRLDGGAGSDTVNINVTGATVTGSENVGGLNFANVESVVMTNTAIAVVDASMMSGNLTLAGGGTQFTIHGLAGNFNGGGGGTAGQNVTVYSSSAGGQTFTNLGAATHVLYGSQGDGAAGDTFAFGSTLDSTDFVQAFDFSTTVSDTLTATLSNATFAPSIFGVETVSLSTGGAGTNTFDATNVVGTHTWTVSGTQNFVLSNLNWSPTSTGQMIVTAATVTGTSNITGSDGNDSITGGSGANTLTGGEGADTLTGGVAADNLSGEGGNDSLVGAGAADNLLGGDGNDTFNIAAADGAGVDTVDGGAGSVDALDYSSLGVTANVNLETGIAFATTTGNDIVSNIERVIGSTVADTLTGKNVNTTPETFQGRGGNDTINGGSSANGSLDFADYNSGTVNGVGVNLGGSSVVLVAGGTILAGRSLDLGAVTHGADVLSNIDGAFGGGGDDVLVGGSASLQSNGVQFELWRGLGGDDVLAGSRGAIASTIADGTGTVDLTDFDMADYSADPYSVFVDLRLGTALDGFGGTDLLFDITHVRGSAFDDMLVGGNAGNDAFEAFEGGGGHDHINGGSGFDLASYQNATSGVDANLLTGIALDGQGGIDSLINVEGLEGSDFADTLTGSGTLLAVERFIGGAGNDVIVGNLGEDMADYQNDTSDVSVNLLTTSATDGSGGTDSLVGIEQVRGSQFSDTLIGDGLANRLDGGRNTFASSGNQGNDTLTGNGGADTFVFNTTLDATNNNDEITDFVTGVDKIELDDAIFAGLTPGAGIAGFFALNPGGDAVGANDYITFDNITGILFYDLDGSGGGAKVQFGFLTGVTLIADTDFIVV